MTSEANSNFISLWKKLNSANPPIECEDQPIISIIRQAKKSFVERQIKNCLSLEWELGINLTSNEKIIFEHQKQLKTETRLRRANKNNNLFIYITVSPPTNITLERLQFICNKQVNRPFVKNYWYVIEQRGFNSETIGSGLHSHLIIERNVDTYHKPSKIMSLLRDGFSTLFKSKTKKKPIILKEQLYIYPCGLQHAIDLDYKQSKLNYLLGYKIDKEKLIKLQYDLLFRQQNDFPNLFTNTKINYTYNPNIKLPEIKNPEA